MTRTKLAKRSVAAKQWPSQIARCKEPKDRWRRPGGPTDRILTYLEKIGKQSVTATFLSAVLRIDRDIVSLTLYRLKKKVTQGELVMRDKMVRISGWEYPVYRFGAPEALYELGSGPDVKRPTALSKSERQRIRRGMTKVVPPTLTSSGVEVRSRPAPVLRVE